MSNKTNRRQFLKKSATAAFGTMLLPHIIPSSALGMNGVVPPSDRIVLGSVGVGSMGTGNMRGFLPLKQIQHVAVCDVDLKHAKSAKEITDEHYGNSDCRTYGDYREFFEKEKLDAVSMALPDHWHALMAVTAANIGLHVYGEKPLSRSIEESKAIVKAVKKNNIIWQTGSWQRSVKKFHRAAELVRNGKIGNIKYVEVGLPDGGHNIGTPPIQPVPEELNWDLWLGPAMKVPYRGVSHWNWRWILAYSGGQLTDWAGHHIDIAHWGLGLDETGPIEVEGKGVYPREGLYDAPAEYDFLCKYENGIDIRVANASNQPHGMGTTWYGEDGKWIHVDRSKLIASDRKILEEKILDTDVKLYVSKNHHQNFVDCILSGKETITPARIASRSIAVAHLGEIAMLTGRKIKWDPVNEQIIGDEKASRLLGRPYRKPFAIPTI